MANTKDLNLANTFYKNIPAFTDVFDEETFYVFAFFFVLGTVVLAFIISRYVSLKPVDN